ncbi:response regulator transcription factor [Luteimicrobium xylanilyticum]|uniref:Chemotaxis response regulator protein-glutamate methylesterase of group 1 operon n=1 Tax=Luteimicrobium xylanilyticum TaxID=1133546 RepID=A0A5P9Q6Z8_9MICO|nr:response regulator transcription factor [Luteimicrobium xylanilyticum]QFU96880.1 Chemotaxis response regulator protein-glutamate methylesterase of group 1 operon [Luteimicrobium xylanilyticum]
MTDLTTGPGAESGRVRVLVADDQAIVRDGLVTILDLAPEVDVVGQAADGAEAVAESLRLRPDVVLMDLDMPVLDGTAATVRLAREAPGVAVLVLSTFGDRAAVAAALRAGARGYLTKDADRHQLIDAVRAVAHGQAVYGGEVDALLRDAVVGQDAPDDAPADHLRARFPTLTPREAEVLALIAEGAGNREIARHLVIGVSTVKSHVNAIFAKIGARDRAQAIVLARPR